jgi:ATP-dependent DNA helicase PIF1
MNSNQTNQTNQTTLSEQITLSAEQQYAFDKYLDGHNLFISGPGGTGKSALIKHIYQHANSIGSNIQVCALTGCAGLLLGSDAKTIHSWSGIGIANAPVQAIIKKITSSKFYRETWEQIQILICDEVSMMSLKIFELLDKIGKAVRLCDQPFGGIQVIFCGDFFQLPPVGNSDEPDTIKYCFESNLWNNTFDYQICLKTIFRQSDPVYIKILSEIRHQQLSPESENILNQLLKKKVPSDSYISPTKLFPTRSKVNAYNHFKMDKLDSDIVQFEMRYHYDLPLNPSDKIIKNLNKHKNPEDEIKYLQSNLLVEQNMGFKVGAQVMCVINIEDNIVNGSQGIIIKFDNSGLPVVLFKNGITKTMDYHVWRSESLPDIGISQIPLILAWALTIHKSQGVSLDMAEIDVGNGIFECGQTYVALSRVRSLDGLYLKSFNKRKILTSSKVKKFYQNLFD